jgi:ankyrin repeat protein
VSSIESIVTVSSDDDDEDGQLIKLCTDGRVDDVRRLLQIGQNSIDDIDTALIVCARAGHVQLCAMLVDAGANVNYVDCDEWTALRAACYAGHVAVVDVLLKIGK